MRNNNVLMMKRIFTEFLILDLKGESKAEKLMNIANFAFEKGLVKAPEVLYQRFVTRERERSVAIIDDIAFPEACKVDMNRPYAFILCRPQESLIFERPDIRVRIILASLFAVRPDTTCIRTMVKLTDLLRSQQFCEDLLKARDENEVYCAMARFYEVQ